MHYVEVDYAYILWTAETADNVSLALSHVGPRCAGRHATTRYRLRWRVQLTGLFALVLREG